MNGLENAVLAMLVVFAVAFLCGAIAPAYCHAMMKLWYEFCGMNCDAFVKSPRRMLIMIRVLCGIGFLTMVALVALILSVLSEF
jgi:hypothetical protein